MRKKEQSFIYKTEVERLKQYYPYNEEERVFTIPYHYERLDEILDKTNLASKKPKADYKVLKDIEGSLNGIPNGYKADIEITIDDYQGRNCGFVMNALRDITNEKQFIATKENEKNSIKAGIITLVGVFCIILSFAGDYFNWWGASNSVVNNTITGFLNVYAVVFIWEAVNMTVIRGNPFIKDHINLLKKMRYFIIKDNNGKEIKELLNDIDYSFSNFRFRAISNTSLMFCSFAFFGLTMLRLIRYFSAFFIMHYEIPTYELSLTPALLSLMCVLGAFGILIYKGYLKFLLPSLIISIALFATCIVNLVLVIINQNSQEAFVASIAFLVVSFIYIIGLIIKYYLFKKSIIVLD